MRRLHVPRIRIEAWRETAGQRARALGRWSRRPTGRLAVPGIVILLLVALTGTAGAYLVPGAGKPVAARASAAPSDSVTDGAGPIGRTQRPTRPRDPVPPFTNPDPNGGAIPGREASKLAGWATQMSAKTEIPQVALEAYGYAEFVLTQTQPSCQLRWTTLAALGKVESDHGRANGASVTPDGRAYPPIIGPALNGQGGHKNIVDTDQGQLDNDPVWDHAIGPMQFIPTTWQSWKTDADSDGQTDPHDLDDSTLAAAKYLCSGGRDLSTAAGWENAILSYNDVQVYRDQVFAAANDYGTRSH